MIRDDQAAVSFATIDAEIAADTAAGKRQQRPGTRLSGNTTERQLR